MAEKRIDEMKGRTKEAAGDLSDDEELQEEGKADQRAADAKDKIDRAAEKAKEKVDEVAERFTR